MQKLGLDLGCCCYCCYWAWVSLSLSVCVYVCVFVGQSPLCQPFWPGSASASAFGTRFRPKLTWLCRQASLMCSTRCSAHVCVCVCFSVRVCECVCASFSLSTCLATHFRWQFDTHTAGGNRGREGEDDRGRGGGRAVRGWQLVVFACNAPQLADTLRIVYATCQAQLQLQMQLQIQIQTLYMYIYIQLSGI